MGKRKKLKLAKFENNLNVQKQPLEVFYKKAALKNFAIFIEERLCWSLFLRKLFQHIVFQ